MTWLHVDDDRDRDLRDWATPGRYERIIELRNSLLAAVRQRTPRWFLSCDTDMLLHPDAIANLLETAGQGFDVVGAYAYMDDGRACPSWGRLTEGGAILRQDVPGYVGPVDVVMGVKLMSSEAYAFDYSRHSKGEDAAICVTWRKAGLRIALDARVTCKHVMEKVMLGRVDARCGF